MRRLVWLGAFLALAISAQGCTYSYCPGTADAEAYIEPPHVVAQAAPPPPPVQVEVQPAQPTVQSVWVDGHYSFEAGRWVWIAGSWQTPRAGYVWQAPVGVAVSGGVRYHPGYWRPAQAEPPPVYRQPSAVAVTVHAQGGVNTSGSQQVVVQQPNYGGNVVVQAQPAQSGQSVGTVVVQGQPAHSGGVQVVAAQAQPAHSGSVQVVAAQPAGNVVVAQPVRGGVGVVAAQPAGAGTVVAAQPVRGGVGVVAAQQPVGAGTVVAAQPVRGGVGVVAAQPVGAGTVQAAPVGRTGVRPGTVVGPQQANGTVGVQAGVRPATVGGIGQGGVSVRGGAVTQAQGQLSCRLAAPFAPRGGAVVINGSGLNGAVVMIGGTIAPTMSGSANQVTVQVPSSSRGGTVTVSANGQNASCGGLRITGEM